MGKVTASTDINQVKADEVAKFTDLALQDIVAQLNGEITFGENIKCRLLSVTFSAANTEMAVSHTLGKVPRGYLPFSLSASANVYDGDSGSTNSVIYLKASAPATVGLIIF